MCAAMISPAPRLQWIGRHRDRCSNPGFLTTPFAHRSLAVFSGLVFVMALVDLMFDLLGHQIDGSIHVRLRILRVKIRAGHVEADGALKLADGGLAGVVFQNYPRN